MDSSTIQTIGPNLLRDDWRRFDYYSCVEISLSSSLKSYLIYTSANAVYFTDAEYDISTLDNVKNGSLDKMASVLFPATAEYPTTLDPSQF